MRCLAFAAAVVCGLVSVVSTANAKTVCNDAQAARTINVLQNQKQEVAAGTGTVSPQADETIRSLAKSNCFQTVGPDPVVDHQDTVEFGCTLFSGVYQNVRVYWTSCPSHVATFIMRNGTNEKVGIIFYAMERDAEWPGDGMEFTLEGGQSRQFTLQCGTNERVCYGGWFEPDYSGSYWGIGRDRANGCDNCCTNCGYTIAVPDLVR